MPARMPNRESWLKDKVVSRLVAGAYSTVAGATQQSHYSPKVRDAHPAARERGGKIQWMRSTGAWIEGNP